MRILVSVLIAAFLGAGAACAVDPDLSDPAPPKPKKPVVKKVRRQPSSPVKTMVPVGGGSSPVRDDLASWQQRVLGPIISTRDQIKRDDEQQNNDFINGRFTFPNELTYYRTVLMPRLTRLRGLCAGYGARTRQVQQLNAAASQRIENYMREARAGEAALAANDLGAWTAHLLQSGSSNLDAIVNDFNSVAASALLK